jgi:GTP-binding protein
MKTPIVSIVGRPNVGKSTFFNKIAGRRIAIESDIAGTTRDRIFHRVSHKEIDFLLVDTGGITFGKESMPLENDVRMQAKVAIEESDVILFMVNGKEPLIPEDYKIAELLRKGSGKKPVLLVVNKCDKPIENNELAPLYQFGMGEPHAISALHRSGLENLTESIVEVLKKKHFVTKKEKPAGPPEDEGLKIALVGKPNVGKSSLVNALLQEDKLIVSDIPGTTRDSIDSIVRAHGKNYTFIDTAGLRKKGQVDESIEKLSNFRTLMSIDRCDIACLVLDSSEAISHQDQAIVSQILKAEKGMILILNKWDQKHEDDTDKEEEKRRESAVNRLGRKFSFMPWAPVLFTSARTKKNLSKLFEIADGIQAERTKRITTSQLNQFMKTLVLPGTGGGASPKIYYITQVGIEPPHFVVFANKEKNFHFSHLRFLENRIREKFGFNGTPIKIEIREKTVKEEKD